MIHGNDRKKTDKIFLGVIVILCVFLAFTLFIRDNNRRATSISVKSLKDSTVQSAQRINEVIKAAQNEIRLTASLYENMIEDSDVAQADLQMLEEESSFDYIEFVESSGMDMNADGKTIDVSDRVYYQEGMKGNSGVEALLDSRITKERLVVFYTPLYYHDEIIGVLTGSYRENKMQEILYNTFFDEDARTFLCLRDGQVIASCNKEYSPDSVFENESFNSNLGENVEKELREALLKGEEYEFQYQGTAGTGHACVTTIGDMEWMLIQTFPSQVTSQFIQEANKAGIYLLAELIGIFVVCIIVLQVTTWIQKKKLIMENVEKTYVVDGLTQIFDIFVLVDLEKETYQYLADTKPRYSKIPTEGNYGSLREFILELMEEEEERENLASLLSKDVLQKNLDEETDYLRYEYRNRYEQGQWDGLNLICLKREAGVPTKVLFTYQDVTKVKERELRGYEALKAAYEAVENANRAKSTFLSNMSHDIRTPMNAIMGMTSIAVMNIDHKERVQDCLKKISVSSQHLLELINEVLDMSKIESGKLNLMEEELDLADVVDHIVAMFLPQTQAKHQEFKVNIADITHEEVIGDRMRLQQILINILGNAVKFTPEGGNITFGIAERVSDMQGYGCYVFTVEDTGIGMEESYMEKLFEPFVRADNTRTSQVEGTGLGMPIVKNIVQMMNGDIQVESKLNEGSKFIVTVYLKRDHFKQESIEGLENLTVLVADDDRFACESACGMLRELGIDADWVMDGEKAIEMLMKAHREDRDYSAAILDWKMPEKDGVETAREIRAKIGDEVPIIILSAFDYSEIEQEARAAGVNAFISKPLFRSRLVYVMKSLMFGQEKEYTEVDKLQSKDYSGKRVLLVEDNELNMEIAKELLKETGVMVETVVNGRLAVERIHEMPAGYYNMVFMDIQMPEMNGYEATKAIRGSEREDLKILPIVAMSADAFTDDVKHAKDVGMNGHVAKPIEIEKLISALEKWI